MIRKTIKTSWCTVGEWDNPEEAERDWEEFYEWFAKRNHWKDFINDGDLTIDIGAHTGDTSLVLGALSHNVLAFEPNPEVYPVLEYNCNLNPKLNIHPYKVAITDCNGKFDLYDHSTKNCNMGLSKRGEPKFRITGCNLVNFLSARLYSTREPKFIKIDCEGYDIEIFNSIPEILKHKPVIFMEWHTDVDEDYFLSSISKAGYQALDPLTFNPVTEKIWDVLCLP